MSAFDAIVVGNGAVGLAIARSLSLASLRVALIGDPARALSASAAAGAMLGGFGEVTPALRASALGREKIAWAVAAASLWPSWIDALSASAGRRIVSGSGTFVIASGDELSGLASIEEELSARGVAFDRVARIDDLPSASFEKGLFLSFERWVDASQLLAAYDLALRASCTVFDRRVVSVVLNGDRVSGVSLGEEVLSSPRVVIASGFDAPALMPWLELPSMLPGAGVALLLDGGPRLAHVVRTPTSARGGSLHLVPRSPLYLGATNVVRETLGEDFGDAMALLSEAVSRLDRSLYSAKYRLVRGVRPMTADGFPLIGPTSIEGLFVATGTGRDGLHLSPQIAAFLTPWILGSSAARASPFPPERSVGGLF